MKILEKYLQKLDSALKHYNSQDNVQKEFYEPVKYIMNMGGKRLRPCLVLAACDAFGGSLERAMPACIGVEIFHNFTLVHDDIMDKAPLRRGKPTVHQKWDINTAILSGDVMMIMAYQQFEAYGGEFFRSLVGVFNTSARKVCEGQQLDLIYETEENVSLEQYLRMIELKTAVLLGAAMRLGAMLAEADEENCRLMYDFGVNLGMAFQLQDDHLDSFGNEKVFGKRIGGDICENKRTFLYIKAKEIVPQEVDYCSNIKDEKEKIAGFQKLYRKIGVDALIQDAINGYTGKALGTLEKIAIDREFKTLFLKVCSEMLDRKI